MIETVKIEDCISYEGLKCEVTVKYRSRLQENIVCYGLQEPLTCVKVEDKFLVIDGRMRLSIARSLSLMSIKIEIISVEDIDLFIIKKLVGEGKFDKILLKSKVMLVEAYYRYLKNSQVYGSKCSSLENCSRLFGVSERQISRFLRLAKLDYRLIDSIENGYLSLRAGVELSYLDEKVQCNLINSVGVVSLSYRDASLLRHKKSQKINWNSI